MPTNTTLRLERPVLLAWTVALTLLVALKIGSISPTLAWALLPYLALVARHLIAPTDRKAEAPCPAPAEPSGPTARVPEPEVVANPPDPGPGAIEPAPDPAPARPPAARPRRKARPRVIAEPAPAAWVEVAPGRFVREADPEPPTPPEIPEATPPGPLEAGEPPEVASESASQPAESRPLHLTPDLGDGRFCKGIGPHDSDQTRGEL